MPKFLPGSVTTHRTTGDLGWPNSKIPVSELHGQFYFPIKDVLEEFDLKGNVEKNGYKFIDKLLDEQGESAAMLIFGLLPKQICIPVLVWFV